MTFGGMNWAVLVIPLLPRHTLIASRVKARTSAMLLNYATLLTVTRSIFNRHIFPHEWHYRKRRTGSFGLSTGHLATASARPGVSNCVCRQMAYGQRRVPPSWV